MTGTRTTPPDHAATARAFHEAYERLAPSFGYETRKESAVPWEDVPENNRALMTAVCAEVVGALVAERDEADRDRASYQARWHEAERAYKAAEDERDLAEAENARRGNVSDQTTRLHGKYTGLRRTSDGSEVEGWYFVIRDEDPAGEMALLAYADACESYAPELAADLRRKVRDDQLMRGLYDAGWER